MPVEIDYFFTSISPFAYLGHDAFLALAARHGARVRYRPVKLTEVFAETGGVPLAKRAPARQRYRLIELQRWRDRRGIALNLHPAHFPTNPTLADRSAIAIAALGDDPGGFVGRAMRACWVEERDIAKEETVRELLVASGLDAAKVIAAAGAPQTEAAYSANTEAAVKLGAFGSPCYMLNGEPFWGQDRLELLGEALASGRPPYAA